MVNSSSGWRLKQAFSEHDFVEFLERRGVLVDLGAQHRSFPGVDQERGEHAGITIGANIALLLGLPDAGFDRLGPLGEDRGETLADELAVVRQLRPEIADQAAPGIAALCHIGGHRGEVATQPLVRPDLGVFEYAQGGAGALLPIAVEHGRAERLLAREMIVERTLGNAGALGDPLPPAAVEAATVEDLDARIEEPLAHIWSRHRADMTSRLTVVKRCRCRSRQRKQRVYRMNLERSAFWASAPTLSRT